MYLAKISLHDIPGNNFEPNKSKITKMVFSPHVVDGKNSRTDLEPQPDLVK